ncbi:MAG: hypothetical protein RJA20_2791 [Bacteroidota bacterium]|jgi:hypothetical protein
MAQQTLKDRNNNTIGYILTDAKGRQTIKDKNMVVKGYYDPETNVTKDKNLRVVGRGNLLATLI